MNKSGIPDWLLVYFMLQIDFPDGDVKVNKAKFIVTSLYAIAVFSMLKALI